MSELVISPQPPKFLRVVARLSSEGRAAEFCSVLPGCTEISSPLLPCTAAVASAQETCVLSLTLDNGDRLYFAPTRLSSSGVFVATLPAHERARSLTLYLQGAVAAKFVATRPPVPPTSLRLRQERGDLVLDWDCPELAGVEQFYHVLLQVRHNWEPIGMSLKTTSLRFSWPELQTYAGCLVRLLVSNGLQQLSCTQHLAIPSREPTQDPVGEAFRSFVTSPVSMSPRWPASVPDVC